MRKKVTFGQYYSCDSIIHKLDPRVKLFATLIYLIELFSFTGLYSYIILSVYLLGVILMSKVPIKNIFASKGLLFIMIFASSFNLFWINGNTLVRIGKLSITDKGVMMMGFISIRLIYLFISTSILMLTTTQNQLTAGMTEILKPLKKIKVPVHEMAMITSIMLRFIPVLFDEANKIKSAQIARGMNFKAKKLKQRIKNYIPMFIPLFISVFKRSEDLAIAMEARGYRGDIGRTQMKPLKYKKIDYFSYWLIFIIFVVLAIIFYKNM